MRLYGFNNALQPVQLGIHILQRFGIVQLRAFQQLVCLEHESACRRDASRVARLKVNEAAVVQARADMVELSPL